ncbi:hypothetical protein [Segetibacter koreensis]|uniref:hypothetical protein n=1 Tax=Segetibacter koreensis TaxID=398037 RepID=UPI0003819AD0|nr:hypothetical protein [Segetibacter koreensis]
MVQYNNFFMRSPEGENDGGNISQSENDKKSLRSEQSADKKEEENEKKPLMEKIHDALQDWSNEDQREQDFDDTRP